MIAGVADTHAAIWYLFGDPHLSTKAKEFIDRAAATQCTIQIAPISLAEIVYLIEKRRLPASIFEELRGALRNPDHVLSEAPFNAAVVEAMRVVSRDCVPDMPDRIVAATALYLGVPVISRDGRIRASTIQTIW